MPPSRGLQSGLRLCKSCLHQQQQTLTRRRFTTTPTTLLEETNTHLPRIANPSLWTSLIPKPLRRKRKDPTAALSPPKSKEWNPYTIFIVLGIVVGSNAIQLIGLRNEMINFNRKTDARLETLREVIQRVKDGEVFDVKKALGTGDAEQEKEWEEVMKELGDTNVLWEGKKKRDAKRVETEERRRMVEEERRVEREGMAERWREERGEKQDSAAEAAKVRRPKFMM